MPLVTTYQGTGNLGICSVGCCKISWCQDLWLIPIVPKSAESGCGMWDPYPLSGLCDLCVLCGDISGGPRTPVAYPCIASPGGRNCPLRARERRASAARSAARREAALERSGGAGGEVTPA